MKGHRVNIKDFYRITLPGSLLLVISGIFFSIPANADASAADNDPVATDQSLWTALSGGKFDFSAEWRYEHVDDNVALDQANASLLRTTLGYSTGQFFSFDGRIQVQDVRAIGPDDYNDATGRPGAKTSYAVVADPEDTDFIEGYIGFNGIPDTVIRAGRQLVTYRDAPFHRFMGTILWRRNWQNHDAITVMNKSLPNTTLQYAYSWNINRIFTDRAVGARAEFDSNSHLFNAQYTGFSLAKLEGYTYLLDFDNAAAFSTDTFGIRASGAYPATQTFKLLYAGEYAYQSDAANNPADYDVDYLLAEIGGNLSFKGPVQAFILKFSYEQLEGDGSNAFNTILGTNHAYQGWADRFLITPADGIEDYYVTAIIKAFGAQFIASYHDLNSDNLDYDYGTEIDLQATMTFKEHYSVGIKYAYYDADVNANNAAGPLANDTSKFWVWAGFKF